MQKFVAVESLTQSDGGVPCIPAVLPTKGHILGTRFWERQN